MSSPPPADVPPALRLDRDEAASPEHAGRALVFPVVAGTQRASLVWLGVALASTVVALTWHVLGLFAALFAVAMAARSRPAEGEAVAGHDALEITLDGAKRRYPLPLAVPLGDTLTRPWHDADGRAVEPHPRTFPASARTALQVRSTMHGQPRADQTLHEAIWMSDLSWRGRREGWVAVALAEDGPEVLGVYGDRESHTAALAGTPHRLFGVHAVDSSGKGAQVGLPSEVHPDLDPAKLPLRDDAF